MIIQFEVNGRRAYGTANPCLSARELAEDAERSFAECGVQVIFAKKPFRTLFGKVNNGQTDVLIHLPADY